MRNAGGEMAEFEVQEKQESQDVEEEEKRYGDWLVEV